VVSPSAKKKSKPAARGVYDRQLVEGVKRFQEHPCALRGRDVEPVASRLADDAIRPQPLHRLEALDNTANIVLPGDVVSPSAKKKSKPAARGVYDRQLRWRISRRAPISLLHSPGRSEPLPVICGHGRESAPGCWTIPPISFCLAMW
jgi:hypothetical protein